jgi:ribosomal protein L40E
MSERYKVCPECGAHNSPSRLECIQCEADLTGVKIVDSVTETQTKENAADYSKALSDGVTSSPVRICECGNHNPPQLRKCEKCGEDISDVIPTMISDVSSFAYELKAIGDDYSIVLDRPVAEIGREALLSDYLSDKIYVSRRHAKLLIVEGKVFVENLSGTNHTYINNHRIEGDTPSPLNDGDELALGGMEINGTRKKNAAYFIYSERK